MYHFGCTKGLKEGGSSHFEAIISQSHFRWWIIHRLRSSVQRRYLHLHAETDRHWSAGIIQLGHKECTTQGQVSQSVIANIILCPRGASSENGLTLVDNLKIFSPKRDTEFPNFLIEIKMVRSNNFKWKPAVTRAVNRRCTSIGGKGFLFQLLTPAPIWIFLRGPHC